jgi:hypothetical protein
MECSCCWRKGKSSLWCMRWIRFNSLDLRCTYAPAWSLFCPGPCLFAVHTTSEPAEWERLYVLGFAYDSLDLGKLVFKLCQILEYSVSSNMSYSSLPKANCVALLLCPPRNRCATGCGGNCRIYCEAGHSRGCVKYSTMGLTDGNSCFSKISDLEKPGQSAHLLIPFGCLDMSKILQTYEDFPGNGR